MKNKHTTGTWKLREDGSQFEIFSHEPSTVLKEWRKNNPGKNQHSFTGSAIASCSVKYNGSGDDFGPSKLIGSSEVEANAMLITAAPELLKACSLALRHMKHSNFCNVTTFSYSEKDSRCHCYLKLCKEAVKKATGK